MAQPKRKPKPNPLRLDPTRTAALRMAVTREVRKRFGRIKAAIVKLVVDDDAFGLKARKQMTPGEATLLRNAFCPTGEGGGQDNSCSPGKGTGATTEKATSSTLKEYREQGDSEATHAGSEIHQALMYKGTDREIVRMDGKIVGAVSSGRMEGPGNYRAVYHLGSLVEGKGVGQTLMKSVLEKASQNGEGISLTASDDSVGFYQKLGFKTDGTHPNNFKASPEEAKQILKTLSTKQTPSVPKGYKIETVRGVSRIKDPSGKTIHRVIGGESQAEEWLRSFAANAFCPTGPGGGSDNSCSPGKGSTGSRPIPYGRSVDAVDPDGNSVLHQDVADLLNVSLNRVTEAEQGHVSKRSRDPKGDRKILNALADNGRLPPGVISRGMAFSNREEAAKYVEELSKSGRFQTRESEDAAPESFTQDSDISQQFATRLSRQVTGEGNRNAHGVILEIDDGAKGSRGYSMAYGESEVILPRGQSYKVLGVSEEREGDYSTFRVKLRHDKTVRPSTTTNVVINAGQWASEPDPIKIQQFQRWIKSQLGSNLRGASNDELWLKYTMEGLKKGAGRSYDDVHKKMVAAATDKQKLSFYQGTKSEFLKSSFNQPVAIDKVKLLAGRTLDELDGIGSEAATKMTRTLTDGLVQGKSPHDVARDMTKQLDITRSRAEVIARTETIRAHAEGQLLALEAMGVGELGVAVEWSTTGDEKVCAKCRPLEGIVVKISEAKGMLPRHPNCRCAWVPANVGEPAEDQKRSKGEVKDAIEFSMSFGGAEDDEGWGPAEPISKNRPESVLNAIDVVSDFVTSAFCPTGDGGGQDNSCSPGKGGGGLKSRAVELKDKFMNSKVGKLAVKLEHQINIVSHKMREVAIKAAKSRGMSDEKAASLHRALVVADFAGGYAAGIAAGVGVSPVAGKVASLMPTASAAYVLYSSARNPIVTAKAAADVFRSTFKKGEKS